MSKTAAVQYRRCREGGGRALAKVSAAVLAFYAFPAAGALAQSTTGGNYTTEQAAMGKDVFAKTCAVCHGDHLQGGAGPALAGEQFLSVSQFQKISAEYFFHFMSTHMPLTHPGSLTKDQYLGLMAYILQVNGYPAGSQQLTSNKEVLEAIKIEPQH
jgi:mono/diheme cytochrome c family protein